MKKSTKNDYQKIYSFFPPNLTSHSRESLHKFLLLVLLHAQVPLQGKRRKDHECQSWLNSSNWQNSYVEKLIEKQVNVLLIPRLQNLHLCWAQSIRWEWEQERTCVKNENQKLWKCAYTNPFRSQSKGREASRGMELCFVVNALDLELNMTKLPAKKLGKCDEWHKKGSWA